MARKNTTISQKSTLRSSKPGKGPEKLYTLDVHLVAGPVSEEFEDKEICRTIQIRGSQTLKALHDIIFKAFDRWDGHLYEFNLGEGPRDRSKIFSLSTGMEGWGADEAVGDVAKTTIESLGLTVGRVFGYWFDFGDDWLHQINVVAIDEYSGSGRFPKIIRRVGESPPQYLDIEDEIDEKGNP